MKTCTHDHQHLQCNVKLPYTCVSEFDGDVGAVEEESGGEYGVGRKRGGGV